MKDTEVYFQMPKRSNWSTSIFVSTCFAVKPFWLSAQQGLSKPLNLLIPFGCHQGPRDLCESSEFSRLPSLEYHLEELVDTAMDENMFWVS